MGMIAKAWLDYSIEVMPKDAPKNQWTETRRAFMAGAVAMFGLVNDLDPGVEPTLNDLARFDALALELEEYRRDVENGRA